MYRRGERQLETLPLQPPILRKREMCSLSDRFQSDCKTEVRGSFEHIHVAANDRLANR